jgi:ketosteroid isomerase-like protein
MKHISDFFPAYQEAAFNKDIPAMVALYDNDIVIFDMWQKGFSAGLKEWSVTITEWLTSLNDERVTVDFEMIEIQESETVGFASALIRFRAISPDNKELREMKNRISLGCTNRKGEWKVKHQHTSAPIDGDLRGILQI